MAKENDFTSVTTIATNDFIRVLKDTSSRKMTKGNFVTDITQLLIDAGFLTSGTLPPTIASTRKIETFAVNHTLVLTDDVILMDATGGNRVVDLPLAADAFDVATDKGQRFTIKKIDVSVVNTVTIDPAGTDLIDGQVNIILQTAARPFVTIISDGSNWFFI